MSVLARLPTPARYVMYAAASIVCGSALVFAAAVIGKVAFKTLPAEAATSVLSPKFCLGGWSNPKNASGPGTLSVDDPVSAYTAANSAVLESPVSAQIFCGYFDVADHVHQPSKVRVKFQWATKAVDFPVTESLSSSSGSVIATSTGLIVATSSQSVPPTPQAPVVPPAPPEATSSPDVIPSPVPVVIPDAASSTPAPPITIPVAPTSTPTEASSSPVSLLLQRALMLVSETAHAATSADTSSQSAAPFLQVSYSVDGVRWTVIGTVGEDNLAGYQIDVPVASWSDVASLQIMVSVLPGVDKKPGVYFESMSANVEYDRTLGETLSDTVGAAADALDVAVANVLPKDEPQQPASHEVTITRKKLVFTEGNATTRTQYVQHTDIKTHSNSDGSSLTISGNCSKKYYVILVFRNQTDFAIRPSSALVNGAWECDNGSFSYDLSTLSLDMKTGRYYVVTGEEDDTGPWKLVSPVFPVDVIATTTSETVTQP